MTSAVPPKAWSVDKVYEMFPCLKERKIFSIIIEQHAQKILGLADRVMILERGTNPGVERSSYPQDATTGRNKAW